MIVLRVLQLPTVGDFFFRIPFSLPPVLRWVIPTNWIQ